MKKHRWLAIGLSVFVAGSCVPAWVTPVTADAGTQQAVISSSSADTDAKQTVSSSGDQDATAGETVTSPLDQCTDAGQAVSSSFDEETTTTQEEPSFSAEKATTRNNAMRSSLASVSDTCTVTFDGNGGKWYDGADAPLTWEKQFVKGSNWSDTYTSGWREGYVFRGWSTDKNASKPMWTYSNYHSLKIDSNITLYAVWEAGYRITFNGNGGKVDDSDSAPSRWIQEVKKDSPIGYTGAWRKGYVLIGWSTDPKAAKTEWSLDEFSSMIPKSDMEVYAVWAEAYTFTLDGNGGRFQYDNASSWKSQILRGSHPEYYITPLREGYILKGWSTDKKASEPTWTYNNFKSITLNSDMTLYAVWEEGYHITFDGNGGRLYDGDTAPSTWMTDVVKGSKIGYSDAYRKDYALKGWSTDKNATEPEWTTEELSSVTPDSDMTLYAVWATGYKITFDGNGGKNNYSDDASSRWTQEVVKGSKIRFALAYREGYEFKGWSTDQNATEPEWTAEELSSVTPDSDMTLYAVWAKAADVNKNTTNVRYKTHVQTYGESQGWVTGGKISGTQGESKRMEAIYLELVDQTYPGDIQYRTHVQTYGWNNWVSNGKMSGTEGQSKRLEAIQICLTGEMAEHYDVYYRVHAQNFGWLGWAKNGEQAGTAGYSYRLEAIQVQLVEKKGGKAPGSTENAFYQKPSGVRYRTHVQSYGNQNWVSDGASSGTQGESKRLEGIWIELTNPDYSGSIQYQTHVQTYGWNNWVSNGKMSGTEGQSKRLEAIRIQLTGEMAKHYDIYYRVHAQNFGWMGWAKNGDAAGTAGYSYRLEAIQIKLVPKGQAAPGSTENSFYRKA